VTDFIPRQSGSQTPDQQLAVTAHRASHYSWLDFTFVTFP